MRRIVSLLAALVLAVGLGSCGSRDETPHFDVRVTVKCPGVYMIWYDYSQNGEPLGGGYGCNADGTAYEQGQQVYFSFEERSFPNFPDMAGFGIVFSVGTEGGRVLPASGSFTWDPSLGGTYDFTLTGIAGADNSFLVTAGGPLPAGEQG